MKTTWLEIISYMVIILFVLGIFYFAFSYTKTSENSNLQEGEIVQGEKEIKQELIKEADNIQEELNQIGDIIQ